MKRATVPTDHHHRLWGAETAKAVDNFQISGEPIPSALIRWLGRIKEAAALVNAELGLLDGEIAAEIAAAAADIGIGRHDSQFPVDVFQTGSGTSSNMNANEVISALTDGRAHPNDHVNLGQSSNDVFPSAVHLALLELVDVGLLPALDALATSLQDRAAAFDDVVKAGRTHLMDAVPVTLGQEFSGYAAQVTAAREHVAASLPELGRLPLGGTAVGNGLNTHPQFADLVRSRLAAHLSPGAVELLGAPRDHFAAQAARDALAATSGAFKVVAVALTKICNDVRWMASGPRTGLGEIVLPELQKGSSIMPGKVNPVIPEAVLQVAAQVIGNDTTVTVAAMQGNFELNVMVPVIARNVLQSCTLLTHSVDALTTKCVNGIVADVEQCRQYAELTLAAATALNPRIGYEATTELVNLATATGRPLREVAREAGVADEDLEVALDLRRLASGSTIADRTRKPLNAAASWHAMMCHMAIPAERLTEDDVRHGLPVSALANVSTALGVSTTELIEWLHVSSRTWARRKAAGRFDALESDRLARLIRLVRRASTVVGGEAEARAWLTSPARALNRRTPLEVASTEIGAERVFQLLGRIEHGVFT